MSVARCSATSRASRSTRFNHKAGVDRPLITQYIDWMSGIVHGDLGNSFKYQVPVSDLIGPSFVNSLKLAAIAFVIVVPLSIIGGTVSGLRRNSLTDRVITTPASRSRRFRSS